MGACWWLTVLDASVTPPVLLPACQAHSRCAKRRLVDSGCLAVLDAFGTCADAARMGLPALLAPELVQARAGAAFTYTPASDMWYVRACVTVKQGQSCEGQSTHPRAR